MTGLHTSIHGFHLRVTAHGSGLQEAIRTLLEPFATNGGGGSRPFILKIEDRAASEMPLFQECEFLDGNGGATGAGSEWRARCQQSGESCSFHFPGLGLLSLQDSDFEASLHVQEAGKMSDGDLRMLLRFAVFESLKRAGLYMLHAAAVEKEGRGILIPGESGSGKTTALLALVRAGYRCLSDDHPLLSGDGDRPIILPFLADLGIGEKTARFFPEVSRLWDVGSSKGRKLRVALDRLYPGAGGSRAGVQVILFPEVTAEPRSRLEPLPRSRALEMLLSQAALTPPAELARPQFLTLARTVAVARCHRLRLGQDVAGLPDRIAPLLRGDS